jgi:hypothetical protein
MVNDMLKYIKELTCEEAKLLDEGAVEECLNLDNNAPVVLQPTDSKIVDIVIHPDRGSTTDEDDDNNEEEKISIDKCISLTEELIHGLEQKSFIIQQHIKWVYEVQEVLQKKEKALNV